jgi:hypothetical protein
LTTSPTNPDHKLITLGKETFTIPPLPLGATKRIVPMMMDMGRLKPEDYGEAQFDQMVTMLFIACQVEKPDLTMDEFLKIPVTAKQLREALNEVAGQSGLEKPEPGKAGVPGEASPKPPTSTG